MYKNITRECDQLYLVGPIKTLHRQQSHQGSQNPAALPVLETATADEVLPGRLQHREHRPQRSPRHVHVSAEDVAVWSDRSLPWWRGWQTFNRRSQF